MNKFIGVLLILVLAASCKNETEPIVKITTEYGDIKIRLYDKTPKHRDNFLKLVEEKFYDGLLFHRVINHFMIQGGDPTQRMRDRMCCWVRGMWIIGSMRIRTGVFPQERGACCRTGRR